MAVTWTDYGEFAVLDLSATEAECWCCGAEIVSGKLGIPVYEDLVLPNDWKGEWGGVPACRECFDLQSLLREPVMRDKMRRLRGKQEQP